MEDKLYKDLVSSLERVIAYQKGGIELKEATVGTPDEELIFYSEFKNYLKTITY